MSKQVRNKYITYGHRYSGLVDGLKEGWKDNSLDFSSLGYSVGKSIGKNIGAIGTGVGTLMGEGIGGGYQSGTGSTINAIGNLGAMIPGPGGAILGGGTKIIGGLVNAAFGSKVDQEKLNAANEGTAALNSFKSNAESFDDIKGPAAVASVQDAYKGGWFAKGDARRKNEELRRQREQAIGFADRSVENNIENIADEQMNDMLANYAAFGGPLHTNGTDWSTGISLVGAGGSHESNPLEGVPMGIAPDGTPNLVEEGEVIFNDYVFSKRLKVPKAVREKYKLRGTKDLTFADAAKKAQKESEERPNDPISKRGLEVTMQGLMVEQESVRQKKAERESKKAMFAYGGPFGHIFQGKGIQPQQMFLSSKGGIFNDEDYNPAMVKEANFAKNTIGKRKNYMQSYMQRSRGTRYRVSPPPTVGNYTVYLPKENEENKVSYPLTPNTSIATTGNESNVVNVPNYLLRPEEGLNGIYFNYNQPPAFVPSAVPNRKTTTTAANTNVGTTAASVTTPSSTTTTKRRATTKVAPKVTPATTDITPQIEEQVALRTDNTRPKYNITPAQGISLSEFPEFPEPKEYLDKIAPPDPKYSTDTKNGWWDASYLRYAPALGAGLGVLTDTLGLTNVPDYSDADAIKAAADSLRDVSFTPIGDYLGYRPFDRLFYANQLGAQAGATRRNIMNTSGGNRGVAMAGLLGADYNTQNALGNLYRQAEEYNLGQRQKVAEFNRGTNQFNAEGDLKAQMANIDNNSNKVKAAIAAAELKERINDRVGRARSANLTNFFNSLGAIGEDTFNRKERDMLLRSGVYGNLSEKPLWMSSIDWDDMLKKYGREKKCGGKLKKRKGLTI